MTSRNVVSIIATHELIRELKKHESDKMMMTDPIRIDSSAGVLDAPLTPDQAKEILEMVKVVIELGTAVTTFYITVWTAARMLNTRVVIKDSETGKIKSVIDPTTSAEEVEKMAGL